MLLLTSYRRTSRPSSLGGGGALGAVAALGGVTTLSSWGAPWAPGFGGFLRPRKAFLLYPSQLIYVLALENTQNLRFGAAAATSSSASPLGLSPLIRSASCSRPRHSLERGAVVISGVPWFRASIKVW